MAQGLFNVEARHRTIAQTRLVAPKIALVPVSIPLKRGASGAAKNLGRWPIEAEGELVLVMWHESLASLVPMSGGLDRLPPKPRRAWPAQCTEQHSWLKWARIQYCWGEKSQVSRCGASSYYTLILGPYSYLANFLMKMLLNICYLR